MRIWNREQRRRAAKMGLSPAGAELGTATGLLQKTQRRIGRKTKRILQAAVKELAALAKKTKEITT